MPEFFFPLAFSSPLDCGQREAGWSREGRRWGLGCDSREGGHGGEAVHDVGVDVVHAAVHLRRRQAMGEAERRRLDGAVLQDGALLTPRAHHEGGYPRPLHSLLGTRGENALTHTPPMRAGTPVPFTACWGHKGRTLSHTPHHEGGYPRPLHSLLGTRGENALTHTPPRGRVPPSLHSLMGTRRERSHAHPTTSAGTPVPFTACWGHEGRTLSHTPHHEGGYPRPFTA